ncbi:MAG: 50S ribosomal protein L10 [bacterium]
MPSEAKVREVAALRELVRNASGFYFLDFTGVSANDFNQTRRQLRAAGAQVRVVKNRLALRALTEGGVGTQVADYLRGATSVVLTGEDAIMPARVIREVARKLEALKIKGAYVENQFYGASQFDFLASLPTKADLRGQVVGVLSAPMSGLVMALDGMVSEFVYILEQLKERRPDAAVGA